MESKGIKVLLIASSETADVVMGALAHAGPDRMAIRHVERLDEAPLERDEADWDIILSSLELPGYRALDLERALAGKAVHIPVVLIMGTGPDELAARCLEAGMDQFIQCNDAYLKRLPGLLDTFIARGKKASNRLQVEKKLLESEERYLDIFDNTSDLVQCVAPDGSFLYTNRAWRDTMGYTQEEVLALRLPDILHPDSMVCCQDRFRRLLDGEALRCIDFKFVTQSGEPVHLKGDCGAIVRNGAAISTRGIFRNVTDTVMAENALRASEARYQVLYDNAPDIYTTINSGSEILSINLTGGRILGYEVNELIGESTAKIIHPADQATVFDYIERQFDAPSTDDGIEYRMVRKDGHVLWVHQRVGLEAGNTQPRMLVVCRDVTERLKLREQLAHQASHDTLTNLINRREFERRLQRLLSAMSDRRDRHTLCFLDLDQFKTINDTCGHIAGDELLRQIAALMAGQMRSRDTLARLGGDEFAILMEHCGIDKAVPLAEKVRESIERFTFHWRDQRFSLGVSIGVVPIVAGQNITDTLSRADAACYEAKKGGRNRVHATDSVGGAAES